MYLKVTIRFMYLSMMI